VQAAIRLVKEFDGQWQSGFTEATRQRELGGGVTPGLSIIIDRTARFDEHIAQQWKDDIEPQVGKAHRDAMQQMSPQTPNQQLKDADAFSSSMKTAAAGISLSGDQQDTYGFVKITQDQRDKVKNRFIPLEDYLNALLKILGDYIERPMQPQ
jgi:hypothetical protein